MTSNAVYDKLKSKKGDSSFSELLMILLNTKKVKTGNGLRECLGIIKKDEETKKVEKTLKIAWKDWNKKYA